MTHPSDQDQSWEGFPHPKIEKNKCVLKWSFGLGEFFTIFFFFNPSLTQNKFFLCQFSELELINSALRTIAKVWLFEHINCSWDLTDSDARRSYCLKPSLSKPNLNLTQCNYLYLWSQMKQMEYFFNILIISKQYLHIILTVDQKMWPLTIQYLVNYPYLWSETKQYRAFVQ